MKKVVLMTFVFSLGFITKIGLDELERFYSLDFSDQCIVQLKNKNREGESECYGEAKKHLTYQVIANMNFQPQFWKNTYGRCIDTKGTKTDAYFECNWWNRFSL